MRLFLSLSWYCSIKCVTWFYELKSILNILLKIIIFINYLAFLHASFSWEYLLASSKLWRKWSLLIYKKKYWTRSSNLRRKINFFYIIGISFDAEARQSGQEGDVSPRYPRHIYFVISFILQIFSNKCKADITHFGICCYRQHGILKSRSRFVLFMIYWSTLVIS